MVGPTPDPHTVVMTKLSIRKTAATLLLGGLLGLGMSVPGALNSLCSDPANPAPVAAAR